MDGRPKDERHFTSAAVEALIPRVQRGIGDPALATIFENCFPNTLDTTVFPGSFEGKPDTYIVTGDIDAMWLRDSSAQVWPYVPLAKEDARLRELLEGAIRRQARMILLDPYANAFMRDATAAPLSWAVHDKTEHRAGRGRAQVGGGFAVLSDPAGAWVLEGDRGHAAVRRAVEGSGVDDCADVSRAAAQGRAGAVFVSSASRRCRTIRCRWAGLAIRRGRWG